MKRFRLARWGSVVAIAAMLCGCGTARQLPQPQGTWEPVNCVPVFEGEN
jgi:hypothetical protein